MPPRQKNTTRVTARVAVAVPTIDPIPPAPITPIPIAVPITPTAAPAPITAAVNANILRNPQRHRQRPVRFRENAADEGEFFHLENVSGDEEDEVVNPPAPAVGPAAGHSPLQTAMSTILTDPLATGGRVKLPKSSANVHFFFRQDPITLSNICKACE